MEVTTRRLKTLQKAVEDLRYAFPTEAVLNADKMLNITETRAKIRKIGAIQKALYTVLEQAKGCPYSHHREINCSNSCTICPIQMGCKMYTTMLDVIQEFFSAMRSAQRELNYLLRQKQKQRRNQLAGDKSG